MYAEFSKIKEKSSPHARDSPRSNGGLNFVPVNKTSADPETSYFGLF